MQAIDINSFFRQEKKDWTLVRENYHSFEKVLFKSFAFDGFEIKVQFNSERFRSSGANISREEIGKRSCFLCLENRPAEQNGIIYPPYYQILVNPYPIFSQHLTIPDNRHIPQRISGRIEDMLNLADDLREYIILYNGPQSGASAPDHFHFQAGNKGCLPLEKDILSSKNKKLLQTESDGRVFRIDDYLRSCFGFESENKDWLVDRFNKFYDFLQAYQQEADEPMFNIVCWKEGGQWELVVFPRKQHRPHQFYDQGEKQLLISPGVVDFAGLIITTRKEDYEKMNKDVIKDIYSQLSFFPV